MWVLLAIIVIVYLIWNFSKPDSDILKAKKGKLFYNCYYYGGFDDISVKANNFLSLIFNDETLDFTFHKNGNILNVKNIKYKDIVKVKFMNEVNITREVSLGKMICFGWLSLAMKDEKKNIREYVVIEIKDKEEKLSIVLEDEYNNESLLNEIKRRIDNN